MQGQLFDPAEVEEPEPETWTCYECGGEFSEVDDRQYEYQCELVCEDCYDNLHSSCEWCMDFHPTDEMVTVQFSYRTYGLLCHDCYHYSGFECESCGYFYSEDYYYENGYCQDCHYEQEPDDFGTDGFDPEGMVRCGECNTFPVHFDDLSEQFLCDCEAAKRVLKDEAPRLRADVLAMPLTVTDDYGNEVRTVRRMVAA